MRTLVITQLAASLVTAQSAGTFTATGAMVFSRVDHTATLLSTGKVLITGGIQGNTVLASAELYDPSSGTFSATGSMTTPRIAHTATLLADGWVLITGGKAVAGYSDLASAELYDPATGAFTRTGDMAQGRSYHSAVLLANGKVLIAGPYATGSVEFYDPSTESFNTVSQLHLQRPQLTLLADGKVLIQGEDIGAFKASGLLEARALLYDPATSTLTVTGQPSYPFPVINADLLLSGKILDATFYSDGGWDEDFVELYDPSTGVFTGKITTPRRGASATLLSDGTVLIAGGGGGSVWSLGDEFGAETYDPVMDEFSATGNLTVGREGHTATLLTDGTVLIAGGGVAERDNATAEIYHPKLIVPAPVLWSLPGSGQAAILHAATQQLVSSDNPAVAGEALEIYGTGLIEGSVIPPQVAIGGRMAEVLFFGDAPGFPGVESDQRARAE